MNPLEDDDDAERPTPWQLRYKIGAVVMGVTVALLGTFLCIYTSLQVTACDHYLPSTNTTTAAPSCPYGLEIFGALLIFAGVLVPYIVIVWSKPMTALFLVTLQGLVSCIPAMTACATNDDCLSLLYVNGNTSLRNWCVTRVGCDSVHLNCVTWPQCTAWPYLGCLSQDELCVNDRNEPSATDGDTTPATPGPNYATLQTPVVLTLLIVFSIVFVVALLFYIHRWWRRCRSSVARDKRHPVRVPLTSIDAAPDVTVVQTVEAPLRVEEWQWTRVYNTESSVY